MHRARAGIHRDKVGREDAGGARQEGMLGSLTFELAAWKRTNRLARGLRAGRSTKRFYQRSREDECFGTWEGPLCPDFVSVTMSGHKGPSHIEFLRDVELFWMQRDREVSGQGPGCGSFAREVAARNRKFHIDRGVMAVLVFHFRFGQRRLRPGAPEDRLQAFVNEAFFDKDREGAQNLRFIGGVERQIGMLPIAEDAEPLELLALDIDELAGKGLGFLAHFERREAARFLHHLVFDRQPVAIPTGHIGRAKARHRLRFHHEILEDFVQGGPHVHVAVGKRRTVVKDEFFCALPLRANLPVQIHRRPSRERFRLAGRQICLHREPRAGQVESVLPVSHAFLSACPPIVLYEKKAGRPKAAGPQTSQGPRGAI